MISKIVIAAAILASIANNAVAAAAPKLPGWKKAGAQAVYTPQNVWNAINGAAELHMDYGFEGLSVQKYEREGARIDLEIFDQGTPINAFGIFRRERAPKARSIPAGAEAAFSAPYGCTAFKDRFYLRVRSIQGELTQPVCLEILTTTAKALKGSNDPPKALADLPQAHRVKGSEGFTGRNYLGLSDLSGVLHAEYNRDGTTSYELFVLDASRQSINETWQHLRSKWSPTKIGALNGLFREIPYRGPVVVVQIEDKIWGLTYKGKLARGRKLLEAAIASMNPASD
ncbi:MAG: hypothetical protein QNJ97_28055 [Myxococcota bacterium]|nr:hypothetical protein [Myxococcota bacterium]